MESEKRIGGVCVRVCYLISQQKSADEMKPAVGHDTSENVLDEI